MDTPMLTDTGGRATNSMSSPQGRVITAAAWFDESVVTTAAFEAVTIPGSFSVF